MKMTVEDIIRLIGTASETIERITSLVDEVVDGMDAISSNDVEALEEAIAQLEDRLPALRDKAQAKLRGTKE